MTTSLDGTEFSKLVVFLRRSPGRIVAATVPGAAAGATLVERLYPELDMAVEIADLAKAPGEIGLRALELGEAGDHLWVLPLDGRHPFASREEKVAFWNQLNYQREGVSDALRSIAVQRIYISYKALARR